MYQEIDGAVVSSAADPHAPHVVLGTFRATAICGNDITGSCLYTAGLCVATVSASYFIVRVFVSWCTLREVHARHRAVDSS